MLDSNGYFNPYSYRSYDYIAAWHADLTEEWESSDFFENLRALKETKPAFRFGFLSYELKNEVEKLKSGNPDFLEFPKAFFFQPRKIIFQKNSQWFAHGIDDIGDFVNEVMKTSSLTVEEERPISANIDTEKADYLRNVEKLRGHIAEGDIYEINYCVQFRALENREPMALFQALRQKSPVPFSGVLAWSGFSIVSASPERFLKKIGNKLISQPIKGTIKRGQTPFSDNELRRELALSEKERAENVMIVDLTRNDLTRFAWPGTVKVEDLFGVYSFPMVHQMISTVSAALVRESDSISALKQAFPMGSMTGAPKVRAMELIDEYENFRRGPFSGSLGYLDSNGNFDFNVLIRSVFQNHNSQRMAFCAGGAITWESNPENEWQEMQLKASAIKSVLGCT